LSYVHFVAVKMSKRSWDRIQKEVRRKERMCIFP